MRCAHLCRFRPAAVQAIIHAVVTEQLAGKTFVEEEVAAQSSAITAEIKQRLYGNMHGVLGLCFETLRQI